MTWPRKPTRRWKAKPINCPICGKNKVETAPDGTPAAPACSPCQRLPDYPRLLSIATTVWNDHPIADSLQSGPLPWARGLL